MDNDSVVAAAITHYGGYKEHFSRSETTSGPFKKYFPSMLAGKYLK